MANAELLNNCRNYFEKAHHSWAAYFSKWELMATNEDVNDVESEAEEAKPEVEERRPRKGGKRRTSTVRNKLRGQSISASNKRRKCGRLSSICKKGASAAAAAAAAGENEEVHSGKGKFGAEIIHTRENQTNLELESANDKHFEADLKAIFIEILSENANKFEMFSVLSRTFSGCGISDFYLTVKGNQFSIGAEWTNPPPCRGPDPASHFPGRRQSRGGRMHLTWTPAPLRRWDGSNLPRLPSAQTEPTRPIPVRNPQPQPATQLSVLDGRLPCTPANRAIPSVPRSPNDSALSPRLSPREAFSRIFPSPTLHPTGKCMSEKRRKRKSMFDASDDSDDDDDEQGKGSSGSFLKIFCTPKRPRRSIKYEEGESGRPTNCDDDDLECFNILDRVKTKKT